MLFPGFGEKCLSKTHWDPACSRWEPACVVAFVYMIVLFLGWWPYGCLQKYRFGELCSRVAVCRQFEMI